MMKVLSVIGFILIGISVAVIAIFSIRQNYFKIRKNNASYRRFYETIGERGEKYVSELLSDDKESIIFNDILLHDIKTNKSTQIDHIVIRHNGVFVIETKNHAGEIYGDDKQQEWEQVLADGKVRNRLYNPVKQNATHIYFLARFLKQHNIYISIVMFPRAKLHIQSSTLICHNKQSLHQALNSETGITLTAQRMQNIANQIIKIRESITITKEHHIENVIKIRQSLSNNICPRCGNPLVLQSHTDNQFYQCNNFPDCRFIKNV